MRSYTTRRDTIVDQLDTIRLGAYQRLQDPFPETAPGAAMEPVVDIVVGGS